MDDPDNIIRLDDNRPHWQGPMLCIRCGLQWQGVVGPICYNVDFEVGVWFEGVWRAIEDQEWECPNCHDLTGVIVRTVAPPPRTG